MIILTLPGESINAGNEDWSEKLLNNRFDLFTVPAGKGKLGKILKKSSNFPTFTEERVNPRRF
jgi:hypothetical protein